MLVIFKKIYWFEMVEIIFVTMKYLRVYDTIKTHEISLNLPDLLTVLEVKRSKILQKLNKRDCFLFKFNFFMAFLTQRLIYTINIW